ncbi:MAG TPA: ABC transporter ATP-binding protein [Vicinamibacteria bacterium]|nr:ABC transporter ATP-binding protein [Vicinamibacteria bacterium]
MIEVENVTKRFGGLTAVSDLSFAVEKGEILGFLGPNGAGKTTTMRILTGFLPPTAGTARIAGHDILEEPLAAKRKTGYLPENPPLYPEMSVLDYLDFVARIKGVAPGSRKARIDDVIDRCSLGDVRTKLLAKLSRGYRQRVGLAQALVHEPEVLVLDEPTAGLDPKQINETRALIRTLAGDHTVILSTHILPEVSVTCERVVIINQGRVVAQGTPESLTEQFLGGERLDVTVEGPEEEVRKAIASVPNVTSVSSEPRGEGRFAYRVEVAEGHDVRRAVSEQVVRGGFGLLELTQRGMTLEEVYLRAISSEEAA